MLGVYTFWDAIWTMIIFFAWVMFITWVILLMIDNFRRSDHSGWSKALWALFTIFLPIIGAFSYTIARPSTAGDYSYDSGAGYASGQPTAAMAYSRGTEIAPGEDTVRLSVYGEYELVR